MHFTRIKKKKIIIVILKNYLFIFSYKNVAVVQTQRWELFFIWSRPVLNWLRFLVVIYFRFWLLSSWCYSLLLQNSIIQHFTQFNRTFTVGGGLLCFLFSITKFLYLVNSISMATYSWEVNKRKEDGRETAGTIKTNDVTLVTVNKPREISYFWNRNTNMKRHLSQVRRLRDYRLSFRRI